MDKFDKSLMNSLISSTSIIPMFVILFHVIAVVYSLLTRLCK